MSARKSSPASAPGRKLRKFFVSGFVLASYIAYALHERFAVPSQAVAALPPSLQPSQGAPLPPQDQAAPALTGQDPVASTDTPDLASGSQVAVSSRGVTALPPSPQPSQAAPLPQPSQTAPVRSAQKATAPTAAPQAASGSQYKNGTFTGVSADAFYGQVQVQVMIQNGKIASVTFLNYPKDRRTSARINSIATPYLQTEAIQAQSARVNIISGATLTSEAFMASLQSALNSARG